MQHEIALIQAFILKERQQRYLNLVATFKGREKFRSYISHFKDLNPKYCTLNAIRQSTEELYKILNKHGAPKLCYIISEHSEFDKKTMPLYDAIAALFNSGIAYFLSCLPGHLAFYEGEDPKQSFLLIK